MTSLKKLLVYVVHSCVGYDWVQEYTFEHVGRATVYRAIPAYTQRDDAQFGLCTERRSAY
jgi:hypothetical protein